MKLEIVVPLGAVAVATGCASSYPSPIERVPMTEAAARTAEEGGAYEDPMAALHLRLADEEIARAKALMSDGDNKRADYTLRRALADAQLALDLAKLASARREARAAIDDVNRLRTQTQQPER